jgi:hypothetical protein
MGWGGSGEHGVDFCVEVSASELRLFKAGIAAATSPVPKGEEPLRLRSGGLARALNWISSQLRSETTAQSAALGIVI